MVFSQQLDICDSVYIIVRLLSERFEVVYFLIVPTFQVPLIDVQGLLGMVKGWCFLLDDLECLDIIVM
jgi:hypothetical protein